MNTPSYWKDLTPRQQLNDAVHKYAKKNHVPYNEAWKAFEVRYSAHKRVNIPWLRHEHARRYGIRPTVPSFLECTGQIEDAVTFALGMGGATTC